MPKPEKKTGDVRAPLWVSLLVILGVVIVTSVAVLPMFFSEYLSVLKRSSNDDRGSESSDSSQGDFYVGGGSLEGLQNAEQAFTPATLTVPRKFPFAAAFAYSAAGELPFRPEDINDDFVHSRLSLSIGPSVDYLLLFIASTRYNEYSRIGFPDVLTVLDAARPEELLGIVERAEGRFSVFTDPADVANELIRLRKMPPVLESRP
jgi:hypothetical protein